MVHGIYFTSFSVAVEVEQGATANSVYEERPWVGGYCRRLSPSGQAPRRSGMWYHKVTPYKKPRMIRVQRILLQKILCAAMKSVVFTLTPKIGLIPAGIVGAPTEMAEGE